MAKNIIGIDISDFSIEAVVLGGGRGGWQVEAYSRFRLSPDIVDNGVILDKNKLKEALQTLFKNAKPRPLEHKKVFLSIPESKVFSKILSLPKDLKDKALLEAAKHKAEELIPEALDNLVTATKVLTTNGDSKEVFYTAAELPIVKGLLETFKELNIEVVGITTEALSSFAGLDDKFKKTTTLLLDLGSRTTIASIFDNKGIRDSININIAGNNIIDALAKKLQVSHLVAEEKMKQVGLTSAGKGEIMLVIQGQLQPIADELKEFIKYYEETNNKAIEQIVLIGGLAQMQGIDKYFGDNLNKPASLGEAFLHSKIADINSTTYINALGLAKLAQQKSEINFLEHLIKESKDPKSSVGNRDDAENNVVINKDSSKLKKIFKNIYVLIALGIIILAILGFVFKDQLATFYNNINNKEIINEVPEGKAEYNFKQTVIISDIVRDDVKTYLGGELFYVPSAVTVDSIDLTYIETINNLESDFDSFDLTTLNGQYAKDGYYIIPQILSAEVMETNPAESDFIAGMPLTADINYSFMAFSKSEMQSFLVGILGVDSLADIKNLEYSFLHNSIDDYGYLVSVEVTGKLLK